MSRTPTTKPTKAQSVYITPDEIGSDALHMTKRGEDEGFDLAIRKFDRKTGKELQIKWYRNIDLMP